MMIRGCPDLPPDGSDAVDNTANCKWLKRDHPDPSIVMLTQLYRRIGGSRAEMLFFRRSREVEEVGELGGLGELRITGSGSDDNLHVPVCMCLFLCVSVSVSGSLSLTMSLCVSAVKLRSLPSAYSP